MILDDPTLGLDTVVRRDFLESMIQIIQRQGRTILFSSHILGDVERVADRIGVLVDGVLRVDCPTDLFKESIREVVLDFPGPPPEFPPCRGLVSSRVVGRRRELIVVGFGEEHRRIAETPRAGSAVDRRRRDEPGRRVHRIHARPEALDARLCRGRAACLERSCSKELRETGWIVLLAAGAFAYSFLGLIGYGLFTGSTQRVTSIPFADGQFLGDSNKSPRSLPSSWRCGNRLGNR